MEMSIGDVNHSLIPPGLCLSISTAVLTPVSEKHPSDGYTWHSSSRFYVLTTSSPVKEKNQTTLFADIPTISHWL